MVENEFYCSCNTIHWKVWGNCPPSTPLISSIIYKIKFKKNFSSYEQYFRNRAGSKNRSSRAELEGLQLELNPSWAEVSWTRLQHYILYCNSLSHFKVTWVLTLSEFGYCIKGGQNTAWVSLRLIENLGITRNRTDTFSMTSLSEKNRNYEISTMPKRDSLR